MEDVIFRPIGVIRSPFKDPKGGPIQPSGAFGIRGKAVLDESYAPGLLDLDGFSHVIVLYHFHLSQGYSLEVKPFLDDKIHGVFATRAPRRPNPIGLSVMRLIAVRGNELELEDVDVVDGTPLLDVKPCVPEFDFRDVERVGWLSEKARNAENMKADERFLS